MLVIFAGKELTVPKGAMMFLHGYAMALDPELWDEPDEFRPERWLAETPGSGPRNAGLDLHGKHRPSHPHTHTHSAC